jgi:hypothetical protein
VFSGLRRSSLKNDYRPVRGTDCDPSEECCGSAWPAVFTDILTRTMYIQWMILSCIVGYLIVRLTSSSDEDSNRTLTTVALFVLLLPFIPALLIACCVSWRESKSKLILGRWVL